MCILGWPGWRPHVGFGGLVLAGARPDRVPRRAFRRPSGPRGVPGRRGNYFGLERDRGRGGAYQDWGQGQPTSRHTDLWARYRDALSAGGVHRVHVRWVPSHEMEGSDRISLSDKAGNDHADRLASAQAKRIGPTARQGKLYDRRTQQLAAIQGILLKIFAASQATDPPKAQDQAPRGPRAARGWGRATTCARKCHLPTLECREFGVWGPHLVASHGTEELRCITCARVANHSRARYAFQTLLCTQAGVAWQAPSSHTGQGLRGTRRKKPGGGARGRAATLSSGTVPPSTMAGGFA